jgi:hypothetical protein
MREKFLKNNAPYAERDRFWVGPGPRGFNNLIHQKTSPEPFSVSVFPVQKVSTTKNPKYYKK